MKTTEGVVTHFPMTVRAQESSGGSEPLGDLVICAAGPREIIRFKPDGTIVLGDGYTPTEAADAFIGVLREKTLEIRSALEGKFK